METSRSLTPARKSSRRWRSPLHKPRPPTASAAQALSQARGKAGAALDKVNGELAAQAGGRNFSPESTPVRRRRPAASTGRNFADQSWHAAGTVDEGCVRRRAGALARLEGGAGRPRLGAHARVRRDRHRGAVPWRMRSACVSPNWPGGTRCLASRRAPGRSSRRWISITKDAREKGKGCDPRPSWHRSDGARRSPACWRGPRSPTKRALQPNG